MESSDVSKLAAAPVRLIGLPMRTSCTITFSQTVRSNQEALAAGSFDVSKAGIASLLILMPYAYDTAPGQRYRWEQWERELHGLGIKTQRLHFLTHAMHHDRKEKKYVRFVARLPLRYMAYLIEFIRLRCRYEHVVICRNAALAGPPLAEWLVWITGGKIIYDFDDAIYQAPPGRDPWLRKLFRCDWRVAWICRRAFAVGAGNETLARYAQQFCPHVFIWRTTIDCNAYHVKTMRETPPVIGWTGSESTSRYIRNLLPELRQLQQIIPFRLLVVGASVDLQAAGVKGECQPWTSETELMLVQRMDIGLMPLEDTPWEAGKCSLKALQYQAVGIPAVVSDVGMNRIAVKDGETGLLIAPGGDWIAPLRRLLEDAPLRQKMGMAARAHVEDHFSAQVVAAKIVQDLKRRAQQGP